MWYGVERTFKCKRCGWCCKNVVIDVSHSDITSWIATAKFDALQETSFIDNYPSKGKGGFYIAKTAFNPKQPCPFLKNDVCIIYDYRPISCRDFPTASNLEMLKCEGTKEFRFSEEAVMEVKKRQLADFKMAWEGRDNLLRILVLARDT